MAIIEVSDLIPRPLPSLNPLDAQQYINDALARAAIVAPCINDADLSEAKIAGFKAIIRAAIVRRVEGGSGAVTTQGVGPYSFVTDTRRTSGGMFQPVEIKDLQTLCRAPTDARAHTLDTTPEDVVIEPSTEGVVINGPVLMGPGGR